LRRPSRFLWRGLGIALAVLVLDQIGKWIILTQVMAPPRSIEVTGFFNLVLAWNRGVSFSLLHSDSAATRWLLTGAALVITAVLLAWLARTRRGWPAAALGAIIGGALGNVLDRVRLGAVADFIQLHWHGYYWPAFNLADTAITIGVIMLISDGLFTRGEGTSMRKTAGEARPIAEKPDGRSS
jgi:signal peptidase II